MLDVAKKAAGPSTAYDHDGEAARARAAAAGDAVVGGKRLNRASATVAITGAIETAETAAARKAVVDRLFTTTLDPTSPVVELGWPVDGPFVLGPQGVYFDGYLGVAQKVLDERHPRLEAMVKRLVESGLILRREIATDDYLVARPGCAVKTPADLAALWNDAMQARWPQPEGWRAFFSSSGTEAVEAALKLSYETAYKRFIAKHGMPVFRRVQEELGTPTVPYFDRDPSLKDHPVYVDYPFQVVACEGSFHGRTLGSLHLTRSKRAHHLGYPKARNVHHIAFNATDDPARRLIDSRPIGEILQIRGELARIVRDQRRIPKDLLAAIVAEPFQGEGGYVPGDPRFFRDLRTLCDETGALLVLDEVQAVARTGALFATEHLEIRPDVIATAKSMVIGVTLAPAPLEKNLHIGWHSNTWGSGRIFDVNFAWTVLDTLLHHKDPVFNGLSYFENEVEKGNRLTAGLDALAQKHPTLLVSHRGRGLMRGLVVRRRDAIVKAAWQHGLKLLGCGWAGETSVIRLLFLADTLSREIDEFLRVLDATLEEVGRG
jgi:4-aminobutyrate aminotransferase-like enzyme